MPSVGDLQINVIANAAEFQNLMAHVRMTLVQVGATTHTALEGAGGAAGGRSS